jgi:hypothetical protein
MVPWYGGGRIVPSRLFLRCRWYHPYLVSPCSHPIFARNVIHLILIMH